MSRPPVLVAAVLLGVLALQALATETKLLHGDQQWSVEGHFAPGGGYPIVDGTALARSEALGTSPVLWGSWLGDDAHTGTLRSPPFEAPTLLGLFVSGFPKVDGISLFLARERDGARHPLHSSAPDRHWQDERFLLPRDFRGEAVRLVAIDAATQVQGWLGVSTPRALSPSAWLLVWAEETSPVSLTLALTLFCLAVLLPPSLRGVGGEALRARVARLAPGAALGLVALAFVAHIAVLYRYAVDVPYLSEWGHLSSGLARDFSFEWIWAPHDGQRMVFTKLHTWLLTAAGGWNLRSQILQNFALYGALLVAGYAFIRRNAPHFDRSLLLVCFVFSLSSIAHENHQWGIASHFHFSLLALVLSAHFAFAACESLSNALAAGALGAASVLSSASGAACMAGLLAVFALYCFVGNSREAGEPASTRSLKRKRLALMGLPVCLAIATQSAGYAAASTGAGSPGEFSLFFLNLVSGGFGVSSDSPLLGGLWFIAAILPLAAGLARARGRLAAKDWALLSLSVALLSGLAALSFARASLGAAEAKQSRYVELAVLLLPLSAVAWSSLLASQARTRRRVLSLLFALVAFASLDDWNTEPYRLGRVAREGGLRCASHYYQHGSRANCPTIAKQPIPQELERARELGLHFTQRIQTGDTP